MLRLFASFAVLVALLAGSGPATAAGSGLTVFAAASTTNALTEIAKLYESGGNGPVTLSFASSSTLAKQIANGAPAHVFLSANDVWMQYLDDRQLLEPGSRTDLLGNRIVLIVPSTSGAGKLTLSPQANLASLLGHDGRLALGDPEHVPVGQYARAALERLSLWPQVADRLAPASDVRAGLALVERGEAPLGIVYGSDAAMSNKVRVIGTFPSDSHPAIDYPVATMRGPDSAAATSFIRFLAGPQAKVIWARYGFEVN